MLPIPAPRAEGMTAGTAVPLYWCAYGEPGKPKMLVMHGGPGADHRYLLPQMLHLARSNEMIFFDQRGGGRSRVADNSPITWQTHVEDMAAVIRELELEPLTLVGYSFGGLLSLLYALEASENRAMPQPRRILLIDPAPVTRTWRSQFEAEFSRRLKSDSVEQLRAHLNASGLRDRDPEAYKQRAFEISVAAYFADPNDARELTPFRVISRVQQSVWDSLGNYDLLPRLSGIKYPTLIVHGRDDPIPVESSIETAKTIRAELILLDDCGHVPYVEQPEKLFRALDDFLTRTADLVKI
jgi:proline iminopeptidase